MELPNQDQRSSCCGQNNWQWMNLQTCGQTFTQTQNLHSGHLKHLSTLEEIYVKFIFLLSWIEFLMNSQLFSSHLTAWEEAEIFKGQWACWLASTWSLPASGVKGGKGGGIVGDRESWDGEDGAGASGETAEAAADYQNTVTPLKNKTTMYRIQALEIQRWVEARMNSWHSKEHICEAKY